MATGLIKWKKFWFPSFEPSVSPVVSLTSTSSFHRIYYLPKLVELEKLSKKILCDGSLATALFSEGVHCINKKQVEAVVKIRIDLIIFYISK